MEKSHNEKMPVSGFFIGFIFGVASVLLLKSKQGRRILRTIIESGIDKFGDVEDVIRNSIDINDDLIDGDDFIAPDVQAEEKKKKTELIENLETGTEEIKENLGELKSASAEAATTVKSATRRFFRGIKKKG